MSMSWKSFFKSMCMKALKRGTRRREIRDLILQSRQPIFSARPTIEILEDRTVPSSTITKWDFNVIGAQQPNYNSPVPTTGVGVATSLGMASYSNQNGANTVTTDDVLASPGVITPSFSEQTWRIRGNNNGWALAAPQYTQGIELDASTAGYQGTSFSFDLYSTTQGVRDLQIQYNLNINGSGGGTWVNYVAPNETGSPIAFTAASESGTTVTITTASDPGFTVGEEVGITGITSSTGGTSAGTTLWNGVFTVTGDSSTGFTYTDVAGLAAATVQSGAMATPTSVILATPNDFYTPGSKTTSPNVSVNLPSTADNDANLGIRLVSAFDPGTYTTNGYTNTGATTSTEYGAAATTNGTGLYNDNSGNWRFDNLAFSGTLIPGSVITSDAVTASPSSPQNQSTSTTFTDTITPGSGSTFPTGTVQFYNGATPIGSPVNVTAGSGATGVASVSTSTVDTLGANTITAQYTPSTATAITAASWSSNVVTLTLTGSTNPFINGQTITVAGMAPSAYNGVYQITSVSGQNITYSLSSNPGTETTLGTVSGGFLASAGSLNFNVGDPTTTTLAVSPASPQVPGTGITLTATVTPANIGGSSSPDGHPTGTVSFYDSNYVAGISAASESSTTVTITTSAANGFVNGQNVTIAGIAPSGYDGTFAITKIISATQFTYKAATGLGTATLSNATASGNAQVGTTQTLAAGSGNTSTASVTINSSIPLTLGTTHSFYAIYSPFDTSIIAVTESGTTVTVTTSTPSGFTAGEAVDITGITPSGYSLSNVAVTPVFGANQFTYTAASGLGTATIAATALATVHAQSAAQYLTSTSTSTPYTIGDPTTSALTTNLPSPQAASTSITFTDTVTAANLGGSSSPFGAPTGTVQFFDGSTPLGSPVTLTSSSNGIATYTSSSLSATTHPISAVYTASTPFFSSTTSTLYYAIYSGSAGPYTPGNLVVLQAGDGADYNAQAPLYLDEINSAGQTVQQDPIPAVGAATITAASESGTTVTITTTSAAGMASNGFTTGEQIVIAGVGPSGYDGTFTITQTGSNTFTYSAASGLGTATLTSATATPGLTGNQPITIDLSAAAGNGQLSRSYDGSTLTFDGVDSTINNGGLTSPLTPTGSDNRDVAVVSGGDATLTSNINTTTYGPFFVGDDNRGSIAESPTGPLYTAGHPNQAGGAVSQGVHEFDTTQNGGNGAQIGNQVSASTNIRGVTIGFDNRMYFSTASGLGGATALNAAGIFTEPTALPTSTTPTPANDIMVVPAIFGASKLGGVWLADMNGTGVLSNGDRLYFVDDGTVGGAGTGGLYVSTWNTANTNNPWNTPNNAAAAAAGFTDFWSAPVRLGDAPVQTGSGSVGQLRGLTGTVVSAGIVSASESGTTVTITVAGNPPSSFSVGSNVQISGVGTGYDGSWTITGTSGSTFTYTALASGLANASPANGLASQAILYTTAYDGAANDSSIIQQWIDTNTGVGIASASESGNTVTITTSTPNTFQTGQSVEVDGVGANNGAGAITTGYNGAWSITVVDSTHFTYSDTNAGASNLATVSNQGAADDTVAGSIIVDLNSGSATVAGKAVGAIGLRGVSFAPVAATSVTLTQTPPNSQLSPGATVTLIASLINPQIGPTGVVTFINANNNSILGQGAISTSQLTISSAASSGTTATITTTGTQNLVVGEVVVVAGVSVSGYDGTVTVTSVSNGSNTFTYTTSGSNLSSGSGGTATLTTASLTVTSSSVPPLNGNNYVQAYFAGGGTIALASARSNTIQVQEAGSTASATSLTSNLSAAAIAKPVTFTATITDNSGGSGTPTGTVSFYNGSVALANLIGTSVIATVSGSQVATLTTAFTNPGTQSIIAVYNGDNNFASSQGTANVNVAANATATISTSANNVALNATPTYTATIVGNATLGVPAGTVTFTIVSATGGSSFSTTSSSAINLTAGSGNTATATWTSPALSVPGSYFITISYAATGSSNPYSNFAITTTSATSGVALIETVNQPFTPGDLVAVQRGDGTVNLGSSAYPVELDEYKVTGGLGGSWTLYQSIVLPNQDSGSTHALFLSGQNSTEGLLNRSANGAYLDLSGYDLPAGHTFITSTFPYQYPRTIAQVSASGSIDTSTAIYTTQDAITAVSETGTTVTVTIGAATNPSDPALTVGESVVITGVTPSTYDGQYTITGVSGSSFTYTAGSGLGTATVSSAEATSASVPYNPLDVVSYDGQEFWLASDLPVGDTTDNGLEYVSNLGATTATQMGGGSAAALTIAGGQLYETKGSGNVDTVGAGLQTTAGQTIAGLPNLANTYAQNFNGASPEEVLLLNTNNGTTFNPNVAYVADQANGLLKFYQTSAGISTLSESGTTVTVTTASSLPNGAFFTGDQVQISGASVAGYSGMYTITVTGGNTFTYTAASGLANATGGSATEWQNSGQKLVFAGGVTGVSGYVINPGGSAQVQLYVTGSNVQQQNPNQLDSFLDTSPPSQPFTGGNFTVLGFVGGASPSGSPNGNENFAGLSFVPGAVTTMTLTSSAPTTTYGNNVTYTATVTSPVDTPAGTVTFMDGTTVLGTSTLNGSGVATFTTTTPPVLGTHTITAVYNPGSKSLALDDVSTATTTQTIDYDAGDLVVTQVGFSSGISSVSVSGTTVTVTTANAMPFATGQFVYITGNSGTNINGSYSVTVVSPTSFTFTASGAVAGTGGTVSPGSSFSISAVTVSGSTVSVVTGTTSSGFVAGQLVTISGNSGTNINGTFVLTGVSGTTLTYTSTSATAGTGGTAAGATALTGNATATYLNDYNGSTQNSGNTVYLPTAPLAPDTTGDAITGASWSVTNMTATITTSAANNFQPGQFVTISGVSPSGYNGSYQILSVPSTTTFIVGLVADPGTYVSGGSALVDQAALTEGGTSTTQGYITDSLDGHSLSVAGYNQSVGGSTSTPNADIGVVSPSGSVNDSTLLPSTVGGVRAVISEDGKGMWVATGSNSIGLIYVSFANAPSAVTNASWTNGIATITAANMYVAGQTVVVAGISGTTGTSYNGTVYVLSATSSQFTYALATQPTGTPAFSGATSIVQPTTVAVQANNPNNAGQDPSTVAIGTGATNGQGYQLYGDAGNQFWTGAPSIDGPFEVGTGLPETGGQSINVLGTGFGQNFPSSTDVYGGFPTSAQIAISPDGQTIFVADSRTDGLGGLLEYTQTVPNNWVLLGRLQLDTFAVTGASEAASPSKVVTVTTSSAPDFTVGESVSVNGLVIGAYNGTVTVTGVSGNSFTYTSTFTNLASSAPGTFGANTTGSDGGFRALEANFSGSSPVLYATTSATTGNRLIKITGATVDQSTPSLSYTVLATAAPGTAFRGIALAPTAPGTTTSTTSLSTSASSTDFATGVTLTATVTSGATGWVSFINGATGVEIGAAPVVSGTATLNTGGELAPGSYTHIIATYTGNSTYAPSTSSSVSVTVSKTSTSTTLSFTPSPVGTAQSDLFTAVVNVPPGVQPTGSVAFTDTENISSVSVTGSTVTVTTGRNTPVVAGQQVTIAGNSGTNINGTFTVATVTSSSFTYASTGAVAGTGGTATSIDTATVKQVVLNNNSFQIQFVAVFTVPVNSFSAGNYSITATYSGDGYFSTSNSTQTLPVVNSTTTVVTSNQADPTASNGQAVTLSAAVTSAVSGTPTGTVQFYDNTLPLGGPVAVSSGVATLTLNTSLVQSVTVTNATNSTSGSTTTVTLTTNAASPMTVNESATVEGIQTGAYDGTFTVTAVSGNTFSYVDNAANGLPNDTAGGLAIGLSVLTPGLHAVSAIYTPDSNSSSTFAGSTGVLEQSVQGKPFNPSDFYTERNGDGLTPLNTQYPNPVAGSIGTTVYIDEMTPSGTLVQSFVLPTADSQIFNISAASESGTTVTVSTSSPNNYAVGQLVTISGISPSGYDGTFAIAGVSGNTFTYTAASGLGSATVTGATAQGVVHAVVGDGQQSTTGQMTLSGDGQDLFLTGYDNNPLPFGTALPVPTASGSANVPRDIAQISYNGTVATEAFNISMSLNGGIFDGIYSPNGSSFYVSGFNGIYYFPSVTQSASLQGSNAANQITGTGFTVASLESYGGNLYAVGGGSSSGTGADVVQVGTGMPVPDESTVTNASWASGVATITANNNYAIGQTVTVAGITGATGYNGTVVLTAVSSTSFSYALATQPTGTPGFASATASLQAVLSQLPGIPVKTNTEADPIFFPVDQYLTHTNGSNDVGLDTVYISDDGKSFGAGAITKWSYTSQGISSLSEATNTVTVTLTSAEANALGLATGEVVNLVITGESGGNAGYNGTYSMTVSSSANTTLTYTDPTSGLSPDSSPAGKISGFVEDGAITYSETAQQLGFYWLAGVTNPSTGAVTLYTTYGNGGNGNFGPGILYSTTDSNGFGNAPGTPITAATWASGGGGTVTITAANNYLPGQEVEITGITPTGYNGLFTVLTANSTSFTYALSSNPGTATVTGAYAVSLNTIDEVAYEGNGTYSGNETTRGVAPAPVQMTTTLTDNGPNPSTPAQTISITATVASPGSVNVPTGTVQLEDASNGNAAVGSPQTLSNGTVTFNVAAGALSGGAHNLFYVYSGDVYHQSTTSNTVTQTVNVPTTTSFSDNGITGAPLTAGGSIEQGQNINFTVTVASSSGTPTGTVQLEDAANGNALVGSAQTLVGGTVNFSVPATGNLGTGTHQLIAVYTPTGSFNTSTSSQVAQKVDSVFQVQTIGTSSTSNFIATPTGYQVVFNAILNPSDLNIYSSGAVSTTLKTGSTALTGSLVIDPTDVQATFVQTGTLASGDIPSAGLLATGTNYTATLSGTNAAAFTDTSGHVLGSASSSGGADFTATVAGPSALPVVNMPYFDRGYSQPVNITASTSNGLPISITNPTGASSAVTSFSFNFVYNPALLTVTSGTILSASGFSGTVTVVSPGLVTVTASGGSIAAGHTVDVVGLTASVPATAPYRDKELLDVQSITMNGGSVGTGLAGDAVHVTAFLGNTQGPAAPNNYSSSDALNDLKVTSGASTGLNNFKLLDPTIVVNDSTGSLSSSDAFDVLKASTSSASPNIPALPAQLSVSSATESGNTVTVTTSTTAGLTTGEEVTISGVSPSGYNGTYTITVASSTTFTYTDSNSGLASAGSGGTIQPTTTTGGPDPYMYLSASNNPVSAGETFTVNVNLLITESSGILYGSDDVAISFNPSYLQVVNGNSGVAAGSYPGVGSFSISANVNNTAGTIFIGQFTNDNGGDQLAHNTLGSLATITFQVLSGVSLGTMPVVKLNANIGTHNTDVHDYNSNLLTLSPAPDNSAYNSATDVQESVVGEEATLSIPATSASPSVPFTMPVNMKIITPFLYGSDDIAISFNPNVLQVVGGNSGVTVGSFPGVQGFSFSANVVTNGSGAQTGQIFIGQFTNDNGGDQFAPNTAGSLANIEFVLSSNAQPGTTAVIKLNENLSTHNTDLNDYNDNPVTLVPAPDNTAYNSGTDSLVSITALANQPPENTVPAATTIPFNPYSKPGLQAPTPTTVVYSSSNSNAITVSDSANATDTTVLTLTGNATGTSTGPVGTLTIPGNPSGVTITNNGTSQVKIVGSATAITTALNGLIYQPGAGFFGTAVLDVNTTNSLPGGTPSSLSDDRTTSVTVVGLFISEVDVNKVNTTNPSQYIEVFSSVPNYTIPANTYLLGVSGNATGNPGVGVVSDIFNLAGFVTGTDGYLALLEKGEKYNSLGDEVAGGTVDDNSGAGLGFGTGASSKFGTLTNVHTGSTRTSPQISTDILTGSVSFLLIQGGTTPSVTTNIDPASTGQPQSQSSAYNTWNVVDSVGILAAGSTSTSHSYGAVTFEASNSSGTIITNSTAAVSIGGATTPNYVGRVANDTGYTSDNWLGSTLAGTPTSPPPGFTLGTNTSTLATSGISFSGQPLGNIGGKHDWAPQETVTINDGSQVSFNGQNYFQHSQVEELTVTFSSPVNIADLVTDFTVIDANGNVVPSYVFDPNANGGSGLSSQGQSSPLPDTNVTLLVVYFTGISNDTFSVSAGQYTDAYGFTPTVFLNDGNYFLQSTVADISSAANSAVLLDGNHSGLPGSTTPGTSAPYGGQSKYEVDEFWRMFGDTEGRRRVDNTDIRNFGAAFGSNNTQSNYQWFLDVDQDGNINGTDQGAILANKNKTLPA